LGFPPPYKTWYKVAGWKEAWGNKTEGVVKYSGLEESIEILVKYMSKHGPFDGFLTFSGGQTFFRYLYRILFHKDAQTYSSVVPKILNQPIFLISAGAHFTHGHVI
jgi:hypothetical protein